MFPESQQRTEPTGQLIVDFRSIVCPSFDWKSLSHSLRGLHLQEVDFLLNLRVEEGVTTTVLFGGVSLIKTGSSGRQQRTVPYSQLTANRKSISSIGHESIGSHLQPSLLFSCCFWPNDGGIVVNILAGRIITFDAAIE